MTTKSYNGLHFRLLIPEMQEYADRFEFSTKFMYKDIGVDVDTVFEKAVCTDHMNTVYESQRNYCILQHKKSKNFNVTVYKKEKKFLLRDAVIDFVFLCSNYQRVVVSYQVGLDHKLSLKQIAMYKMAEDEYRNTLEIIKKILEVDVVSTENYKVEKNTQQLLVGQESLYYSNPNIQQYSDELRREIHYLKMGRGKKYKIVNGVKINKDDKGIYTYSFELETELHLPDDAPVVVDTATGFHAVGSVLMCEDFQIMLLLDHDLKDNVLTAYLMVEPWKLLEALNKKILSLNPNVHKIAIELLDQV